MGVEWTGDEQVLFYLLSMVSGVCIGVIFDVFTGWGRARRRVSCVFFLDIMFCVLSALLTFGSALLIMDGQLHPLLLFGIFTGGVVEHYSIGRLIGRGVEQLGHLHARLLTVISAKYQSFRSFFQHFVLRH